MDKFFDTNSINYDVWNELGENPLLAAQRSGSNTGAPRATLQIGSNSEERGGDINPAQQVRSHPGEQDARTEKDTYDGTTRPTFTQLNWAHVKIRVSDQLGFSDTTAARDDFTMENALYSRYIKTIEDGGSSALRLLREAYQRGTEVREKAKSDHGDPDNYYVVSYNTGISRAARRLMNAASQSMEKTPFSMNDVDMDVLRQNLQENKPQRLRKRVLENGVIRFQTPSAEEARMDDEFKQTSVYANGRKFKGFYAGHVAVFAGQGQADEAARWMLNADPRLLVSPENNGDLIRAIGRQRQTGNTKHPNRALPSAHLPKARRYDAIDQLAKRSDIGIFFWEGDEASPVFKALAEFSRSGKAARVFGMDKDGNAIELPLVETARRAEEVHVSKKEYAMNKSLEIFDLPVSDTRAKLALSLVRNGGVNGSISTADINKIGEYPGTINELSKDAQSDESREYLSKNFRIKRNTLDILADSRALSNAGRTFRKVLGEMKAHNIGIIGPEDYPASLKGQNGAHIDASMTPPFLLYKGNMDAFRDAKSITGIVGSPVPKTDGNAAIVAASQKATDAVAAGSSNSTLAYILGGTSTDVPVQGQQIVMSPTGAGLLTETDARKVDEIIDKGGVALFNKPPKTNGSYYKPGPKKGQKGEVIDIEARETPESVTAMAQTLGVMSDGLVVTSMSRDNSKFPVYQTLSHTLRVAGMNTGQPDTRRAVMVIDHGALTNDEVRGNRSLLKGEGTRSLIQAGVVESHVNSLPKKVRENPHEFIVSSGQDVPVAVKNFQNLVSGKINDPEKDIIPSSRRKPDPIKQIVQHEAEI